MMGKLSSVLVITLLVNVHIAMAKLGPNKRVVHDYEDALKKSILFFEGQRSGKLPASQRMTWRNNSALHDGSDVGVDLVGGYYDAGDNVKFNFPMAFSTTMLAWSVLEFGKFMELEKKNALDAVRWATDYLLKATAIPGVVYAQVGDPYSDHNCWERPEDMDTLRTSYAVTNEKPGSEVSGEIAAALAAASLAFKLYDRQYSKLLLSRAIMIFEFADNYRGSYNDSLGPAVCPFYCDFNGYQDELVWAATWLHKATKATNYWNYVTNNVQSLNWNFAEFGWDSKIAGINILASKFAMNTSSNTSLFIPNADKFVCSILPESPTRSVEYSPGGLLFKPGGSNLQHATTLSFLMVVYARYLNLSNSTIRCGNITVTPPRLVHFANTQVDYILGTNPMNMSYMVGYGNNFPKKIHHRGSSLPSITQHPSPMVCQDGNFFFTTNKPNPNLLIGAVVGGPDINDSYVDTRTDYVQSEPTTYINAPLVGTLAYFKARPTKSQRSTNYLHKR